MKEESTVKQTFVVKNKMGVHARPAAMIVQVANKYPKINVQIEKNKEKVNGKSIMGVMMLAAAEGSKLHFTVDGQDGEKFLLDVEALFERKFEET
ncbi:MAG: phosphocarrier protein HPr [Verrucomicrobia bacterium GWF2_51_19]|nr:MAG: phosphocarrier protein HPr [Verrucomicrobia bacterium GWF2_51_19]HCJ11799.1 phosphocarrier protein HPr [Opitutae bacterium]